MNKLARSTHVLSWCASCQVQFTETMLPAYERRVGSRPFEMTPFMRFLGDRIEQLRPMLREPVRMRVALHRHPGLAGVVDNGRDQILRDALLGAAPKLQGVDELVADLRVFRPRGNEPPAHQRQFADGFCRTLADDWDGLGGGNVVTRAPVFREDAIEVLFKNLLSPRQTIAPTHGEIMAD